jgi:hypothetical protein
MGYIEAGQRSLVVHVRYPIANTSVRAHLDADRSAAVQFHRQALPRRSAEVDAYAGKAFRPESCGVFASQFSRAQKWRPAI